MGLVSARVNPSLNKRVLALGAMGYLSVIQLKHVPGHLLAGSSCLMVLGVNYLEAAVAAIHLSLVGRCEMSVADGASPQLQQRLFKSS